MKMWLIIPVLVLSFASIAQAKWSTGLVCESVLTINFEGGRYADWIRVSGADDEVRPFLHPDEQTLKIDSADLAFAITMGSCNRGTGDVLVECHLSKMGSSKWAMTNYSFSFSRKDATNPAFDEGITVRRSLQATSLDLVVTKQPAYSSIRKKQTEDAYMHLVVNGVGPTGPVHLDTTRRLGEWTSDTDRSNYDRCVFE